MDTFLVVLVICISQTGSMLYFLRLFEKQDILWEHLRWVGVWRPQGFHSLSQRVFIRSLSNLVNMLVCIMSWPSSITNQIPLGTPELWPFNCPKLGFPLSKSKSFHPVFIKLGGHNISTKFNNLPNPPGTPELWPLNCTKNWISCICAPSGI